MSAITLDHLSGGRLMLGLGATGPQVVEGWYGQPYPKPLARTREYVEILRRIFRREEIDFQGEHYQMPNHSGTGLGKALKSIVKPLRDDIPILLGAEGPKNVAMAAEIADGWLPIFFGPKSDPFYRAALQEGFDRPDALHSWNDFEIASTVPVIIGDDVEACADFMKPMMALYIGGMGARDVNFHFDVFARLGHEEACHKIQDAYLDGRKPDAIAAVPTELIEDIALVGPKAKVLDELEQWKETVLTTMLVSGPPDLLNEIAEFIG